MNWSAASLELGTLALALLVLAWDLVIPARRDDPRRGGLFVLAGIGLAGLLGWSLRVAAPATLSDAFVLDGFALFTKRILLAAALLTVGSDGKITRASLTVGGVAPAPVRMTAIEKALIGEGGSEDRFHELCEACREIDAMGDVYASTEYRQHLATVMSRRALVKAYGRAAGTA